MRCKYQVYLNKRIKQEFAESISKSIEALNGVKAKRDTVEQGIKTEVSTRFQQDVLPSQIFDFIGMEDKITSKKKLKEEVFQSLEKFDASSRSVDVFNKELRTQLELHKAQTLKDAALQQKTAFLVDKMAENNVGYDQETHSLLFMRDATLGDLELANEHLYEMLTSTQKSPYSLLDSSDLAPFFTKSLKSDNFDGLAHLINYVEQNDISIHEWDITRFRSALNFYLNHSFDISKLLTFVRYYVAFGDSCLRNGSGVTDKDRFDEVFGELEQLVDVNALFTYLVERVGSKSFVDPLTKEDPMMNLVAFFSKPEIKGI